MNLKDIPNLLTLLRIFLIPLLVLSFYIEVHWMSFVTVSIFVFASITDFFDGYLARKLHAQSEFGKVLDPISDKLLIAATLMMLVALGKADVVPAIVILCREILISGLREYMATRNISINVNQLGKTKTVIQFIAVLLLIIDVSSTGFTYIGLIGRISLWLAAALTLISGYIYYKEASKHF